VETTSRSHHRCHCRRVVIPPVLDLVNHAYGFVGAPGAELRPHALPALRPASSLPRAGVISADIDWSLIEIGAFIGVAIIGVERTLVALNQTHEPSPAGRGLGIYLPTASTLMIVVGAIAGWMSTAVPAESKPEDTKQLGVLLASGLSSAKALSRRLTQSPRLRHGHTVRVGLC